jgi:alkaline phosphatase D
MDTWDGYAANRQRLFGALTEQRVANPVVLTGDDHSSAAADLRTDFDDESSPVVGVEFVGPSISSGGNSAADPKVPPGGLDPTNPHLRYSAWERGYVRCELTPAWWRADYQCVPYVDRPGALLERRATFVTEAGRPGLHIL